MSDYFDLVKRYPWLPSLKKYYSDIALKDPIEYLKDILKSEKFLLLNNKILNVFSSAFENIEQMSDYEQNELNIHLYLVSRILLYVLNDKIISNRVANLYSKTMYNELNKEIEYNLYYIYQDLNLDVIYDEQPVTYKRIVVKDQIENIDTNFKISFIDYLKLASNLKDEYRKLVNNALSQGYAYVSPRNLNRLIQEHVRMKLLPQNDGDSKKINSFKEKLFEIQEFKVLFENIKTKWEEKKEEIEYFEVKFKEGEDMSEILPSCIKEIFSKAKEGQNLIHTERLFVVWFLNALDYPEDTIVDIFSALPDFNREKTEYQVKYAKKKKYVPYSCKTLKSNTLCQAAKYKDKLCLEGYYSKKLNEQRLIAHPLFYVQFKQFKSSFKTQNTTRK